MEKHVPVPAADADDSEFVRFAHTYHGYELHGGLDDLGRLHESVRDRWKRSGELDDDLDVLRACLFYAVRAHRHGGGYFPFGHDAFVAALLTAIRRMSSGPLPVKGSFG